MVTFDDVLPTLVRICEEAPGFVELRNCCVVRDLHGRVRLAIDPDPARPAVDPVPLRKVLREALGDYFAGPIWSTAAGAKKDEARLAAEVLKRPEAEPWNATYDDPVISRHGIRSRAPWRKWERRLSKQAWLEAARPSAPWQLGEGAGIVTFYSFKGGVGRTTALVACAWQLARAGMRVVVIDLDIEAPGLGTLLDGERERGVIDFLADHVATRACSLDGLVASARALGHDAERVSVLATGKLGPAYLEKLSRLDFITADAGDDAAASPMEQALRDLLFAVRRELKPDYILIDSRAGLHDLAGLSLHRLAHVDVLVNRGTEQGYRGLDMTLGALTQRKGKIGLEPIVVHSFVPAAGRPDAIAQEREFNERVYKIFVKHVYDDTKTIPADEPGPHVPVVTREDSKLVWFPSLAAIEGAFFEPWYQALRTRFEGLCSPGDREE